MDVFQPAPVEVTDERPVELSLAAFAAEADLGPADVAHLVVVCDPREKHTRSEWAAFVDTTRKARF